MNKFSSEEEERPDRPPNLIDELTRVVSDFMTRFPKARINWSLQIPGSPVEIAQWWARVEREPKRYENCRKITKQNRSYWRCPYIDHCVYTLRKFLMQPVEFQDFIIAAHDGGCYWRGDEPEHFYALYEQFESMKQDPEEYKQKAKKLQERIDRGAA